MRITYQLLISFFLLPTIVAHAGLLDDIGRVVDTVKRGTNMLPSSIGSTPAASSSESANSNLLLPLDLTAYPRSVLYKRIDNPLDRVSVPISVPVSSPDGYIAPYSVLIEGKVTMLQFEHRSDDSPLQIQQYYEAWLAQKGFERLLVCEAPCKALPSASHWKQAVDPSSRLDVNYLPDNPTYIAAYKSDAMVLVGIGKFIARYSSLVKVAEGRVFDTQAWQKVTTPRAPMPPTTSSMPAPPAIGAPASQTHSSAQNGEDWFGLYGWKWGNIPAGTPLKVSVSSLKNSDGKTRLYAQQGKSYLEKGFLTGNENLTLGPKKESAEGYVHVIALYEEGWVDYRSVEPVNADYYKAKYEKEKDPAYQIALEKQKAELTKLQPRANTTSNGPGKMTSPAQANLVRVENLAPEQLSARLGQIKNLVVVQFTAVDTTCPQCAQANTRFDTLAQAKSSEATFLRVLWPSQAAAFDDALAIQYDISSLPVFLTLKEGKTIKRVSSNVNAVELSSKLLNEVRK
jgi:hypothetical protein